MLELYKKKFFTVIHNMIMHRQMVNYEIELIYASLGIRWQTIFFSRRTQIFLLQATKMSVKLAC